MVTWTEGVSGAPASGKEANYDPLPGPSLTPLEVKAGDILAVPIAFIDHDTEVPLPLASSHWAAHVRYKPSSEKVCEFQVDTTDKGSGRLVLRMPADQSALMRSGMRTDVVDLDAGYTWFTIQWEVWGDYTHA
jgi:hypothetical protein